MHFDYFRGNTDLKTFGHQRLDDFGPADQDQFSAQLTSCFPNPFDYDVRRIVATHDIDGKGKQSI